MSAFDAPLGSDGRRRAYVRVRLRSLEEAGIVTRRQYAEIPLRVEYALTARGRSLGPVIAAMERWGRTSTGTAARPTKAAAAPLAGVRS